MSEKFGNLPWSRIFQIRKQKEMSEKFQNLPCSRFKKKKYKKKCLNSWKSALEWDFLNKNYEMCLFI